MKRHQIIKWSLAAGKLAILVLLVWFVWGTLTKAYADLQQHEWHVVWPWLVLSGAFYILGTVPAAVYWYQLLRATHQEITRYAAFRAFLVSQLGKYVPGKAMVLVVRAALSRPMRVPTTLVTVTVFLETLTNMAAGSIVALLILAPRIAQDWKLPAAAAAMLLITGLPILPPLFKFALRYSGLVKLNPSAVNKLDHIGFRTIGWGGLMMAGGWWLMGLSLWAVLRSLGALQAGPLENLPLNTAVAAMSVVAGFLALIPGGFGVREIVIIEIATPVYGPTNAVVSAILMRFVSVVSDALVSIILYLIRPTPAAPGDAIGAEPVEAGSNR